MLNRFAKVSISVAMVASVSLAQHPTTSQSKPVVRGVVTVVHTVEVQKLAAQMRREHKGSVGVPPFAPQFIYNIATGLAVDQNGHIVTRLAYVNPRDKDQQITITTGDGQSFSAQLIGVDCPTGFAILEVASLKVELPEFAAAQTASEVTIVSADFIPTPSSTENPQKIFISPLMRTGKGRIEKNGVFSKARGALALRSDTLLSRSDGGVVTTTQNQIVGMAEYAGAGRGYLFPIDYLRNTVARRVIEKKDSVHAGWLGVVGESLSQLRDKELAALGLHNRLGVIVREIAPDSPAAAAGIQPGDIISQIDDFNVTGTPDLTARLLSLPAGKNALLHLLRDRKPVEVNVTLGARPFTAASSWYDRSLEFQISGRDDVESRIKDLHSLMQSYSERKDLSQREAKEAQRELSLEIRRLEERLRQFDENASTDRPPGVHLSVGLIISDLTASLAQYFGVRGGALIKSVVKGSAAERAGLRAGDVIVALDGREPMTSSLLRSSFAYQRRVFSIKVVRDKQPLTVSLDNRRR